MRSRAGETDIRILTPAKVNLILRVLDRRADAYHNLWSVMETVELVDELTLRLIPDSIEIRLSCDDPVLPTDDRNLVVRAARRVLDRARQQQAQGRPIGVDIHLRKRIPVGAGLGGGSSNAAGTISGMNHLLGLGWSAEEMAKIGAELGSDVPFFFYAPTAQIRGRGDEVAQLELHGERWVVLVNPGFPIDTRWAYGELAAHRTTSLPLSEAHQGLAARRAIRWDEIIPLMENDFEAALTRSHPILADVKAQLLAAGAEAALLSGSGSTVFGLFPTQASASRAKAAMASSQGRGIYVARAGFASGVEKTQDPSARLNVG
jgi:4-diphosphocytidyl-2-C-methyl-D-erythritol kinase